MPSISGIPPDDCIGCDRPAYLVPMQGSFLLELLTEAADSVIAY